MAGPARKWVNEPHVPGQENEPHFLCDVTGTTSHVRNARLDPWNRVVNSTLSGAVDLADPASEPGPRWPFGAELAAEDIPVPGMAGIAPEIAAVADLVVAEGAEVTIAVTDSLGNRLVAWSLSSGAPVGMTISSNGANAARIHLGAASPENSPYSVTITGTSDIGSDTEAFTLTVTPTTFAPVLAPVANATIAAGLTYTGPAMVPTQGTGAITYSKVAGPAAASMNSSTGVLTYASASTTGSPHTLTVRATGSGTYDVTWTLTVEAAAVAPVVNDIANQSATTGTAFTYQCSLASGTLATSGWSLPVAPSGMTIDAAGLISYASPSTTGSPHAVTVRYTNTAAADDETFTLTVTSASVLAPSMNGAAFERTPESTATTAAKQAYVDVIEYPHLGTADSGYPAILGDLETLGGDPRLWRNSSGLGASVSPVSSLSGITRLQTSGGAQIYWAGFESQFTDGTADLRNTATRDLIVAGLTTAVTTTTANNLFIDNMSVAEIVTGSILTATPSTWTTDAAWGAAVSDLAYRINTVALNLGKRLSVNPGRTTFTATSNARAALFPAGVDMELENYGDLVQWPLYYAYLRCKYLWGRNRIIFCERRLPPSSWTTNATWNQMVAVAASLSPKHEFGLALHPERTGVLAVDRDLSPSYTILASYRSLVNGLGAFASQTAPPVLSVTSPTMTTTWANGAATLNFVTGAAEIHAT